MLSTAGVVGSPLSPKDSCPEAIIWTENQVWVANHTGNSGDPQNPCGGFTEPHDASQGGTDSHFGPYGGGTYGFWGSVANLVVDVNGDGFVDLVAWNSDSVYVSLSSGKPNASPEYNGQYTFLTPTLWSTRGAEFYSNWGTQNPYNIAAAWADQWTPGDAQGLQFAADVNADSFADLVVVDDYGYVFVELNTGGTGFFSPIAWGQGPQPSFGGQDAQGENIAVLATGTPAGATLDHSGQ